MNVLFVHQNMPGQFKHLARALAADRSNRVVFLTQRRDGELPGVQRILYAPSRHAQASTHHYVRLFENSVLAGQQVARACLQIRQHGFVPDLVVGHPGWGELLFVKDVFASSPMVSYCEYYYRHPDGDVGYDPAQPAPLDAILRLRARNAHLLLSLEACDRGLSPTRWQKSRHPAAFHNKIEVIHDGIDTGLVRPKADAVVVLPDGRALSRGDEVVTYVARNLEPYRGFPSFMRALPELLRRRPSAQVVVVGGDDVSYGEKHPSGMTWRQALGEEVSFDTSRVHFLGHLPFNDYLKVLQVSAVHVYLTVPFVLSWSFLEAMAAGCVVVGSRTAPVEEVLVGGENGFFTDLLSPDSIASDIAAALAHPDRAAIAAAARQTVLDRFDLGRCLPRQLDLLARVAERR